MLILSVSSSPMWSSFDCGFNWINPKRSTYVAARMVPISRSRSGAKTNTPDTYCTGPSTRHSTLVESEPTTTALRSNSHAAAGLPYTDIDSFFVPDPTSQPFAGWSGVMVRRNFFKKRECSTGTTANKTKTVIT
jgi:hypothetical protein